MERTDAQTRLFRQRTLARSAAIDGVGIHTGQRMSLQLNPAPAGTGIVFRRTDCNGVEIPARPSAVASLELATTIGRDDITISTIEHLMAALYAAGVDNARVDLDGPEVPILDGSALPYWRLIQAAGIEIQKAPREILVVTEPIEASVEGVRGDKTIRVTPYPGFRLSYQLDYTQKAIGRQFVDLEIDEQSFGMELAPARTFALMEDVQQLHRAGLGLGGREDNCIVFGEQGPLFVDLRFADEPVRHKALDAVGDLALLGCPIWGHVEVERGGHLLHYRLVEEILRRGDRWAWARITDDADRIEVPGIAAVAMDRVALRD